MSYPFKNNPVNLADAATMLVEDAKTLNRTLKAQWGKFEITASPSLSAAQVVQHWAMDALSFQDNVWSQKVSVLEAKIRELELKLGNK